MTATVSYNPTKQRVEVKKLLDEGLRQKDIASTLGIGLRTVTRRIEEIKSQEKLATNTPQSEKLIIFAADSVESVHVTNTEVTIKLK